MSSLAKVPCTIVTGFLGAGKTTLVRHLLENAKGRRLAVIVNEFGDVGIDGEILKSCGIESCPEDAIVELANGCICCTVADDFVPALKNLLDRPSPPEHIVIETSGLALPKPLVKAFNWPEIASRVTVDGVVTVVDGAAVAAGRFADDPEAIARQRAEDDSLDHDNPLEEVFEDQLLCADLVILNKSDLMSAQQRQDVTAEIGRTLPRAVKVVEAQNGEVPIAVLLGLGAEAESDLGSRPSHHELEGEHDHDDFDTFIVDLPAFASPQVVVDRLARATAAHDILRMKGFVDIAGKPMRLLVQGVGARVQHQYDRRWPANAARQGRLVVIGEKGLDKAGIEALILG
jgi:cobalamin biosynthesis protein CobW